VIRQAHDAGIPVICYNGCITADASKELVYALVTTSQAELGQVAGDAAAAYFKGLGNESPKFGIINCDMYEACLPRKQGFKDAVEAVLPDVQWVADQSAVEPDKTTSVATNELTAHPDLDAIFATTENGTVGATQAVINTGNTGNTVVFGLDMSQQIAQFLISNPDVLIATNGQDPQAMGAEAVQQALAAIRGEEAPTESVNIPTTLYESADPDSINEWLTSHADGIP
jgi:simple sugar transport system substrate-binding protein